MKRTCRIRGDSILDEAGELLLVSVLILLHQVAHVLRHVDAHDVLAVDLSVELLALRIIPREALGAGERKFQAQLIEGTMNTALHYGSVQFVLGPFIPVLLQLTLSAFTLGINCSSQMCRK